MKLLYNKSHFSTINTSEKYQKRKQKQKNCRRK